MPAWSVSISYTQFISPNLQERDEKKEYDAEKEGERVERERRGVNAVPQTVIDPEQSEKLITR